jgi:hypothetical protein
VHWQPDRSAVVRYRLRISAVCRVQFAAVLVLAAVRSDSNYKVR